MSVAIHIRASDGSLVVGSGIVRGKLIASGHTPKELYLHAATKTLRWVDASGNLRAAGGMDVQSSAQPSGALWATGSNLMFTYGGRGHRVNGVTVKNNVAGTTLNLYTSSARTVVALSIPAGGQGWVNQNADTAYFRLIGSGGDMYAFATSAFSGYLITVNGTYTPSQSAQYSCNEQIQKISYGNSCFPSPYDCFTQQGSDGACGQNSYTVCDGVDPHDYGGSYRITTYKCNNQVVGGSSPAAWSISPVAP